MEAGSGNTNMLFNQHDVTEQMEKLKIISTTVKCKSEIEELFQKIQSTDQQIIDEKDRL